MNSMTVGWEATAAELRSLARHSEPESEACEQASIRSAAVQSCVRGYSSVRFVTQCMQPCMAICDLVRVGPIPVGVIGSPKTRSCLSRSHDIEFSRAPRIDEDLKSVLYVDTHKPTSIFGRVTQ